MNLHFVVLNNFLHIKGLHSPMIHSVVKTESRMSKAKTCMICRSNTRHKSADSVPTSNTRHNSADFIPASNIVCIVLTGHGLRRLYLSNMTHHVPYLHYYALISSAQWRKWLLSFTFGPVLINGRCIGYMLADDSCMNRTRSGFIGLTFI